MAVSVLVLQPFAGECGAASGASDQEAASAHIGSGPDQIANALESEHRVINKERNSVDSVIGIRRPRRDERTHRSGFGNAFFENLSVFGFFVVEQRVHIDWLIKLADARVDSDLAKQSFHAKSASFVRNNWHDELADLRIAQQLSQQADEDHSGCDVTAFSAFVKFLEVRFRNRGDWFSANFSFGKIASQLLAPVFHVLNFGAVLGGTIKGRIVKLIIGDRNPKARTEHFQLIIVQLFLLMGDVLALARFPQSVTLD